MYCGLDIRYTLCQDVYLKRDRYQGFSYGWWGALLDPNLVWNTPDIYYLAAPNTSSSSSASFPYITLFNLQRSLQDSATTTLSCHLIACFPLCSTCNLPKRSQSFSKTSVKQDLPHNMKSMLSQVIALAAVLAVSNAAAASNYQGCYSSSGSMQPQRTDTFQTMETCLEHACGPMGKAVLATTHGDGCWCGDSLPAKAYLVDDSKCDMACPGYALEKCKSTFTPAVMAPD